MRISDWSSDVCSSDLPAISRKVPLSLGPPRKVRSIPKAFVIVPLDFTSCNKSAYQPFILSRGYLFRYLRSRVPQKFTNRSEEHTSELQSLMRISYAVFCLKKKKIKYSNRTPTHEP